MTPMLVRCPGCKAAVDTWGDGEVWHEACLQRHWKKVKKAGCIEHVLCVRKFS